MLSGHGRSRENFNDVVVIPPHGEYLARNVDCKLLAWAYLHPELVERFFREDLLTDDARLAELAAAVSPKLKEDLLAAARQVRQGQNDFKLKFLDLVAQSPETLKAFFSSPVVAAENMVHEISASLQLDSSHRRMVGNREFGDWAADMLEHMQVQGKTENRVLIDVGDHVMAVKLQWKPDERGVNGLRVSWYDPDITGDHKVLPKADGGLTLDELRQYTLEDFFPHMGSHSKASDPAEQVVMAISLDVAEDAPSQKSYVHPERADGSLNEAFFTDLMGQALGHGLHTTVMALGQMLVDRGIVGEAAAALLHLQNAEGRTGPFEAIMNGDMDALMRYGQTLKRVGLVGEAAVPLMTAVDGDGTTGLYRAFTDRNPKAVEGYAVLLKMLGIEGEMAVPLMRAVHGEGTTGALVGILDNDASVFESYVKALKHLGITGDMARPLMAVVDAHGVEGTAAYEGDPEVAQGLAGYRKALVDLGC